MKNKFLLWAASALFVITGCTTDVIVDEKPVTVNGRKITLTASMPNEASQTRLSLEQEAGTKNITVKWKAGDVVQFFFKQDATLVAGTPVTLAGTDITMEGKKAAFSLEVPTEIDEQSAFTVYSLHGAEASVNGGKINANVSPVGFKPLSEFVDVPVAGKVEVAAGTSAGNVPLAHLGVLHCLTIRNSAEAEWVFTPSLDFVNAEDAWFYRPGIAGTPYYDLIGETVESLPGTPSSPAAVTVPAGGGLQLVQWVMPNTGIAPEIWLGAQLPEGLNIVSDNSKPARSTAFVKGRAYHLYALWEGTSLSFTDDTLAPPLAIDELTLSGDLMHAVGGPGFIGVVYSKGDGKVYYDAAQTSGSWVGETDFGTGSEARMAVDRSDHPHVVFKTVDNKIAYLRHNGTAWSTPVYIESVPWGKCSKPDIAVDTDGYAHVTYTDTDASSGAYIDYPDIMHAVNSSGDFVPTLIYDGYYESRLAPNRFGHYYNKGSRIAVDGVGNYYILTHHLDQYRNDDEKYTKNTYQVLLNSDRAFGVVGTTYSTDGQDIFDIDFDGTNVVAFYKTSYMKTTSELTVSGNTIGTTNSQTVSSILSNTYANPASLVALPGIRVICGVSGANLFTKYNTVENIESEVTVKAGTQVAAVNIGTDFFSVYTDNADSKIKILKIIIPL